MGGRKEGERKIKEGEVREGEREEGEKNHQLNKPKRAKEKPISSKCSQKKRFESLKSFYVKKHKSIRQYIPFRGSWI